MTKRSRDRGLVMRTRLGAALMLVPAVLGCREASGDPGPGPEVLRGRAVYQEQFCGTCHTLTSAETGGMFGPAHDGVGDVAEERIRDSAYAGDAQTAREYLLESIVEPSAYRVPGFERTRFVMPSYQHLPDADINALVEMLIRERSP